jgi:hyperosmotically inducible periplasmic protein
MKRPSMLVAVIAGGLACAAMALPDDASPAAQANSVPTKNADRRLTQQIRHLLMADKTLSTYAHNVKILVHDGQVTLRGPVRSDAEKHAVEDKAKQLAGAGNVTNDLTVQPSAHAADH